MSNPYPTLKGFLVPITYTDDLSLAELSPEDFDKVASGYACAGCHAEFTTYTIKCPVCKQERDLAADIREAPAHWTHNGDDGEATVARTAEEAIRDLQGNPDVEQIPIHKLRRRKR